MIKNGLILEPDQINNINYFYLIMNKYGSMITDWVINDLLENDVEHDSLIMLVIAFKNFCIDQKLEEATFFSERIDFINLSDPEFHDIGELF